MNDSPSNGCPVGAAHKRPAVEEAAMGGCPVGNGKHQAGYVMI